MNFVEEETILVIDPMFSRNTLESFMDKGQITATGVKTYATKTDIRGEEEKCRSPCHMCKKNHDMDNCKKFLELSVNERSRFLEKTNSVLILSQVTIQQRHVPRGLYVKNVRIIIQQLFMFVSTKNKSMHQEKMVMRKRKKLGYQIDTQEQKISVTFPLTNKLVRSVCVLFQ